MYPYPYYISAIYTHLPVKKRGLLNKNSTIQTYNQVSNSIINKINNHLNTLKCKFNINFNDANKQLPQTFWIHHQETDLSLQLHAVA